MTTEADKTAADVTINISSDDDSDGTSSRGVSSSASDTVTVHRNIAVKRGAPVPVQTKKERPKANIADSNLLKGTTFLENFNPQNSRREAQKRYFVTKSKPTKKNNTSLYDEQGRLRSTGADICDCFGADCEGCHFPCDTCGSEKCGPKCRVNRKFMYEFIEHDGKSNMVFPNPLLTTVTRT